MGPFADKRSADVFSAAFASGVQDGRAPAPEPARVSIVATLVSSSDVVSPLSGERAAILVVELVELVELREGEAPLGLAVLGDLATLRDAAGDEITIVVRRARVALAPPLTRATPLGRVPPELAPLLGGATGRGPLAYREVALVAGDELRVDAVIEPRRAAPRALPLPARERFVVRDDLAPVVLEPRARGLRA